MKMRKQRLMGLAMLGVTAVILAVAWGGRTPEDSDATAAFLTGPLGLYMLLSKTYILYDGEEQEAGGQKESVGEAAPRAHNKTTRKEVVNTWQEREWSSPRASRPGRTQTTPSVRLRKRSSPSRTLRAR